MRGFAYVSLIVAASAPACAQARGDAGSMLQWRDYAASAVAPRFGWYRPSAPAPTLASRARALGVEIPHASSASMKLRLAALEFSGDDASFGPRFSPGVADSPFSGRAVANDFNSTRLAVSGGAIGEFGITAIVARQQFATQGFGAGEWDGSFENGRRNAATGELHEAATGSGVRLDLRGLLDRAEWRWDLAVQSRIEMDPLKSYRGVYSEAGDFDVPGFARVGFSRELGAQWSLGAEMQRVFYSEIPTFTSAALPRRFLSLLGDGSSPDFRWADLTVYALEARYGDDHHGQWALRFASQQQPRPTSALLDRALSELYSDTNVAMSYQLDTARSGQFRFAASYSPVTYFLGASPYVRGDFEGGRQVEFEARWSFVF